MPAVLLADANPTNRRIVELSFDDEPIDVISFSDGLKARDYLTDKEVDVVLADVALPSMDGYELCRFVKQRPGLQQVPVVLMAGRFQMVDLERAEEAGYHSQITKPVEPASLVDLVKDLLSKAETAAASAASPTASGGEAQSGASTKPESAMLFHVTLHSQPQNRVFTLKSGQCRPSAEMLRRETPAPATEPAPPPSPEIPAQPEPPEEESLEATQDAPPVAAEPQEQSSQDVSAQAAEGSRNDVDRVVDKLAGKLPDLVRAILEEERGKK
ncbi:MAG TPA: response regulator [Acidobacteriota bacterium]|nr:response regulator [Acidobacteriota bacterium]